MQLFYVILLALVATLTQTVAAKAIWFASSLGWIGPILPACAAVCAALYCRSAVEAALAGWIFGFALELPLAGETMGLLSLLFAAAATLVFALRDAFYRDKIPTQAILGFLFCLLVYEAWAGYSALMPPLSPRPYYRVAMQVLLVSAYTGVMTPVICAALKPLGHWLWPATTDRR